MRVASIDHFMAFSWLGPGYEQPSRSCAGAWVNEVVPVAMEVIFHDVEALHLGGRDALSSGRDPHPAAPHAPGLRDRASRPPAAAPPPLRRHSATWRGSSFVNRAPPGCTGPCCRPVRGEGHEPARPAAALAARDLARAPRHVPARARAADVREGRARGLPRLWPARLWLRRVRMPGRARTLGSSLPRQLRSSWHGRRWLFRPKRAGQNTARPGHERREPVRRGEGTSTTGGCTVRSVGRLAPEAKGSTAIRNSSVEREHERATPTRGPRREDAARGRAPSRRIRVRHRSHGPFDTVDRSRRAPSRLIEILRDAASGRPRG